VGCEYARVGGVAATCDMNSGMNSGHPASLPLAQDLIVGRIRAPGAGAKLLQVRTALAVLRQSSAMGIVVFWGGGPACQHPEANIDARLRSGCTQRSGEAAVMAVESRMHGNSTYRRSSCEAKSLRYAQAGNAVLEGRMRREFNVRFRESLE
jgi:hypothetical protein